MAVATIEANTKALGAQKEVVRRLTEVAPGKSLGGMAVDVLGGDCVVAGGSGGRVWDEDGKEYVDLLIGAGACFMGHGHKGIVDAVTEQVKLGSTYMMPNKIGVELAEAICEAVPCAEMVRFCSEGSVANQLAIKASRAFTGKTKVLKFEGGYHGTGDFAQTSQNPVKEPNLPQPEPDSAGNEPSVFDTVLVAPYNDIAFTRKLLDKHAHEIACILVTGQQRQIPALPGFMAAVRAEATKHGVVMILDEVVTGFRMAYGGAQEMLGVTPDLCTLGKAVAGGYPLAAVAGKKSIMEHFDYAGMGRDKSPYSLNTLNGNPICAAAGLAALKALKEPGVYERTHANGRRLMEAAKSNLARVNIQAEVVGHPAVFDVVFAKGPIVNYWDTKRTDPKLQARFTQLLLEHGVLRSPTSFFVSVAHTEADIALVEKAFADVADKLQAEGFGATSKL